jgi:hypothetical protein
MGRHTLISSTKEALEPEAVAAVYAEALQTYRDLAKANLQTYLSGANEWGVGASHCDRSMNARTERM